MKIKVNDSLKGELYISCLDLSLRKGQILDIEKDHLAHHDIVWAINKGYISLVDGDASLIMDGKVELKNISNRTLILPDSDRALSPGSCVFVDSSLLSKQGYEYLINKKLLQIVSHAVDTVVVKDPKLENTPSVKKKTSKKVVKKVSVSNDSSSEDMEISDVAVTVQPVTTKKADAKPYNPNSRKTKEDNVKSNNLPQNSEVVINDQN
jgi:hypothetical protein